MWQVHSNMMREIAQTLQEARKMARSIDNAASSLMPLSDGEQRVLLDQIVAASQGIARDLSVLYNGVAPRAFGPEAEK